jgi:glycerol uptake facilitator-like aquaporin
MAAAAGASGARAWLQAHHLTWLSEARMRAITIGLLIAMLAVSSIAFSGTTKPARHAAPSSAGQAR